MRNYIFLSLLVIAFQTLFFPDGYSLLNNREAIGIIIGLFFFCAHYLYIKKKVDAFSVEQSEDSRELLEKMFFEKTRASFPFIFSSSYNDSGNPNIAYFSHYSSPTFIGAHLKMLLDPNTKKVIDRKTQIMLSLPALCSLVIFAWLSIKLLHLLFNAF
ncbi:hypothetical protein HYX58_04980 [Candidatus Dependentiae bacterium]|nr:hypothetical protein [Candidatus Dependentiae bacterium]